jgi:hypothetical protein
MQVLKNPHMLLFLVKGIVMGVRFSFTIVFG